MSPGLGAMLPQGRGQEVGLALGLVRKFGYVSASHGGKRGSAVHSTMASGSPCAGNAISVCTPYLGEVADISLLDTSESLHPLSILHPPARQLHLFLGGNVPPAVRLQVHLVN
jgi:hypothetical protein